MEIEDAKLETMRDFANMHRGTFGQSSWVNNTKRAHVEVPVFLGIWIPTDNKQ